MKILKFGSKTCGPCMAMSNNLKKLKIDYVNCEVDESEDLIDKYDITSIPTLIAIDDEDEEVDRLTGFGTLEATKNWYNKLLEQHV